MCSLLKTGSRSHVVCLRRTRAKSSSDMVGLLPEYWSKWRPSVKELITTTAHLEMSFAMHCGEKFPDLRVLCIFAEKGSFRQNFTVLPHKIFRSVTIR